MDLTIIIIIAIILAVLIVSFIWKLLKTVLKVAIVAVIAFAIFMLITSVIKPDTDVAGPINDTAVNVTNVTNEITAQVTGFVSTTFEKAKANTKKAIAENMLEEAESDLKALE
ncbi:hypothetical protein JXA48_02355 [Candidatus Woesearchaeota archaeon]|nr:hypothetical protein [Candidatus Woesearchaeota archaeon]